MMGWIDDELDLEHFLKKKATNHERRCWKDIRDRLRVKEHGAEVANKIVTALEVLVDILDIVRERRMNKSRPMKRRKR